MLVSDRVYLDLKDKILFGTYLPGVHLVESDLIEEYDVSRATIREALRRLVEDEIVERIPNKGIIVRKLSEKEVRDYYFIIRELDCAAARLVAENHTEEQIEELRSILAKDDEYIAAGDYGQHSKLIYDFRSTLTSYSDNPPLIKMLAKIYAIVSIHHTTNPVLVSMDISHQRHVELLQALEKGDADGAEEAVAGVIDTFIGNME